MTEVDSGSGRPPEWAASALAAEFEPLPRIGVLASVRRYWLLALLPVLVLVPVVGVVAARRTPTYSAEARLMVGRLNLSTSGAVAGFAQAAQDLATTYPLVIYANPVVDQVARQLHMSKGAVEGRLSASSVPTTAIIRVDATGSSAAQAVNLANAASAALVSYLAGLNRHDPDAARLKKALLAADTEYQQAAARTATTTSPSATSNSLSATTTSPPPPSAELKASADTAHAEVTGLTGAYQQVLQNQAVSSLLQPVSSASGATSDRTSKLQIALLAALIAGGIIGVALATARANAVARRALAAPSWQPVGAVADNEGEQPGKLPPLRAHDRQRSGSGPGKSA